MNISRKDATVLASFMIELEVSSMSSGFGEKRRRVNFAPLSSSNVKSPGIQSIEGIREINSVNSLVDFEFVSGLEEMSMISRSGDSVASIIERAGILQSGEFSAALIVFIDLSVGKIVVGIRGRRGNSTIEIDFISGFMMRNFQSRRGNISRSFDSGPYSGEDIELVESIKAISSKRGIIVRIIAASTNSNFAVTGFPSSSKRSRRRNISSRS